MILMEGDPTAKHKFVVSGNTSWRLKYYEILRYSTSQLNELHIISHSFCLNLFCDVVLYLPEGCGCIFWVQHDNQPALHPIDECIWVLQNKFAATKKDHSNILQRIPQVDFSRVTGPVGKRLTALDTLEPRSRSMLLPFCHEASWNHHLKLLKLPASPGLLWIFGDSIEQGSHIARGCANRIKSWNPPCSEKQREVTKLP